jgi:PAS domain S-box-containing protein
MANDNPTHERSELELLRSLADHSSAMLAYWDTELRCRFANRAYERWFGRSPESLLGTHIRELLGPVLYELNLPYIEKVLRGEPQRFEREIPDPVGGPSRHSLAEYVPDVVSGVVRGFFVFVSDISEIKRAELARVQSEAKFSGIVSLSADAIITLDESFRITLFNEGAEHTFGYRADEVMGKELDVLLPERFRVTHREHLRRFAAGPDESRRMGKRRAEIHARGKNGDEFPVDAAISKLALGRETIFCVSLRDISEQKRVEAEERLLAELGEILVSAGSDSQRLLTDVASVMVRNIADWCSVDVAQEDGVGRVRIVHTDPAMAEVCEELERIPVRRERPSPLYDALETQATVLLSEVPPGYVESLAQSPEHLRLLRALDPGSFLVVPLVARRHVVGAIGLGTKRTSRRFGAQDAALVERVASRVALAVDNARLHEALERAVRARDEVLGIVAHDLRNPLNAIVLQAQSMRRFGGEPERRDMKPSQSIRRAAMRMNRLIQDLLDVSRLEAGERLSIAPTAVSVASLLSEASEQQQATLGDRTVVVEAPAEDAEVWADRPRILRVFDNLVGNALKFSRGNVTLGAQPADGEVRFWVADQGAGIDAAALPHVFDRFWQSKKGDRRGAGLGLSIVKGIVLAHGGRVWVESEIGVGTKLSFTLPTASALGA